MAWPMVIAVAHNVDSTQKLAVMLDTVKRHAAVAWG